MAYLVTARKWRPLVLADVVGQRHVTETLQNAFKAHRIAHAYLFSGQRGCGKTTTARIVSKMLNCLSPKKGGDPCNECDVCREINAGSSVDVIEIDGASNRGIEEMRKLREAAKFTPTRGKYKIYIIDEVHMLTKEAFNALLKTLEEPPEHIVFILATTEVQKLPMTILSRCQRYDFRRLTIEEITGRLSHIAAAEKIDVEEDALQIIARKADGSMRDAQSIFDQVHAFGGSPITAQQTREALNVVNQDTYFELTDLITAHDSAGGLSMVNDVVQRGHDLREFVSGIVEHFRNILVAQAAGDSSLIETTEHYKERYATAATAFNREDLLRLIRVAHDLEQSLRWAIQPRYRVETGILQMITMESSVTLGEMLKKLENFSPEKNPNGASERTGAKPATPQAASVHIVGTVSAGALKNYAQGISVTEPAREPAVLASTNVFDRQGGYKTLEARTEIELPTPNGTTNSMLMSEWWRELEARVGASNKVLATMLGSTAPLSAQSGVLKIACPDAFHQDTIQRNREFLASLWQQITGAPVRIETLNAPTKAVNPFAQRAGNGNGAADDRELEKHPFIETLKKELGARLVS